MDLIQINVIKIKTLERVIDFRQNFLPGKSPAVGSARTHLKIHLGSDKNIIAIQSELFNESSGDFFAAAVLVYISCIKIIDAQIDGFFENFLPFIKVFAQGKTPFSVPGRPKLIMPRQILETSMPVFPNFTYLIAHPHYSLYSQLLPQ